MIVIKFNEARWQLQQSKSGKPKAINLNNPDAQPLYGQEAVDAANRQPREPKQEETKAIRVRQEESPPASPAPKAILKQPQPAPNQAKAIAKAPVSSGQAITPKGIEGPSAEMQSFLKHLNASPIAREKKIEYGRAVKKVLANMPAKAKEAFANIKWNAEFYESPQEMADHLTQSWGKSPSSLETAQNTALVTYNKDGSVTLHLDGGDAHHDSQEVYAHEIGHVVNTRNRDGTLKHSDSQEWKDAWQGEVIGKYARHNSNEGFSEFARLVWSGKYKLDAIARSYPKSFAYFQKHGLISEQNTNATGSVPREVFDTYIPLDKTNHVDSRRRSA